MDVGCQYNQFPGESMEKIKLIGRSRINRNPVTILEQALPFRIQHQGRHQWSYSSVRKHTRMDTVKQRSIQYGTGRGICSIYRRWHRGEYRGKSQEGAADRMKNLVRFSYGTAWEEDARISGVMEYGGDSVSWCRAPVLLRADCDRSRRSCVGRWCRPMNQRKVCFLVVGKYGASDVGHDMRGRSEGWNHRSTPTRFQREPVTLESWSP